MISSAQMAASQRVIFMNWSPARDPKALEPPAPPKAPAKPPPLPRWISTMNISTRLTRMMMMFRTTENQPAEANSTGLLLPRLNGHCREYRSDRHADDREEKVRFQAGTADQGAVHVRLTKQCLDVFRFGRAT